MVEQPVEQRGGDDRVAKDFAPFGKAAVGGEDHLAALVTRVDQLDTSKNLLPALLSI